MMHNIGDFLNRNGVLFQVERAGSLGASYKGVPNHESKTGRAYIGFFPETDVQVGDWLVDTVNQRYCVQDTMVQFVRGRSFQLKAFYIMESEYRAGKRDSEQSVFSIGNIYGQAIVGSQTNFTVTYGATIEDLRVLIAEKPATEQAELKDLVDTLSSAKEIKKGGLQRFVDILAKHSDLAVVVGKIILAFATSANS